MNWSIFNNWKFDTSKNYDWSVFQELDYLYKEALKVKRKQYFTILNRWNNELQDLGGDPSNEDWGSFRPLRLGREEDWADWLAFLIEKSSSGYFSELLFNIKGFQQSDYARPIEVMREVTDYSREYRADIIIRWKNSSFTHFEIKVGDPGLLKTFKASQRFQKTYDVSDDKWNNYILLLPSQLSDWNRTLMSKKIDVEVLSLTWKHVSIALRKSLSKQESVIWKVWAHSFIGIIEQKLLGFENYWNMEALPIDINEKIEILEKSLEI